MDKEDLFFSIAAGVAMSFMWMFGGITKEFYMRKDAVKANVAYWTVDENGIPKFHWITE
jgi:hypothetical protein